MEFQYLIERFLHLNKPIRVINNDIPEPKGL